MSPKRSRSGDLVTDPVWMEASGSTCFRWQGRMATTSGTSGDPNVPPALRGHREQVQFHAGEPQNRRFFQLTRSFSKGDATATPHIHTLRNRSGSALNSPTIQWDPLLFGRPHIQRALASGQDGRMKV